VSFLVSQSASASCLPARRKSIGDEPEGPATVVGPLEIARNEKRKLDIAATDPGRIVGKVQNIPRDWNGYVWIVGARTGRSLSDASFDLAPLVRLESLIYGRAIDRAGFGRDT